MLKNVNEDSRTIGSPNPIDGSHNLMMRIRYRTDGSWIY